MHMTLRVACIFLLILTLYMGMAIAGLAFENIQMRKELMKLCR